jgi:hypothetical protein
MNSILDTREYYAEGVHVFQRRGMTPVVRMEVAHCVSGVMAKRIANALNIYNRRSESKGSEKGEHNGNCNELAKPVEANSCSTQS